MGFVVPPYCAEMTFDPTRTSADLILPTIEQEYKILAELTMVESEKLSGIYVIPSYGNSLLWYGVLFVRHGYFKGAVFRFNICLPDAFPHDKRAPSVTFQSEIYHPQVCPFTGVLEIGSAFPQWRNGEDHIWQLLKYIQYVMSDGLESVPFNQSDSSWPNKEAAEILYRDQKTFEQKAKQCVETSKLRVYDTSSAACATEDPHYIVFDEYNNDIHNSTKQCIKDGRALSLGQSSGVTAPKGLSWVKEGSLSAFSAD